MRTRYRWLAAAFAALLLGAGVHRDVWSEYRNDALARQRVDYGFVGFEGDLSYPEGWGYHETVVSRRYAYGLVAVKRKLFIRCVNYGSSP